MTASEGTAPTFEKLGERVYRVPSPFEGGGLTNVYIVRGAKTAVIDSGVLGTPTRDVAPALAALGLSLSDVDLVLNTHGHMDHLGGNSELKDAGAEIGLHSADAPRARSHALQLEHSAQTLRMLGLESLIPGREAFLLRLLGREVGVDRVLEDGDVVDLGQDVRLRVVHTPGHTDGAVCYLWESEGILITGDSLQTRGSRPGGMPVLERPALYPASVKKAEAIQPRRLLMGHAFKGPDGDLGPVAGGDRVAEVFRESLRVHDLWERAVREAVAALPSGSAGDIARRAVNALRDELRLVDEPDNGFPSSGTVTLPGYLQMVRG